MDIAQMRMIIVLADCKSMTTTAKKLRVTQPALTYQLKVIENDLGFKVFNRTRVGTSLTVEGSFLLETIKKIVADYDEAVRLARAISKESAIGAIKVGVNSCSRDTISFLLNVTQSSLSFALVPCGSSDPIRLLQDGVIDLWSTSDASLQNAPSSIRFCELSRANQVAFIPSSHALARRSSLRVEELKDESVWIWEQGRISSGANDIRTRLEAFGTDVGSFAPDVPALVTTLLDDGIVIYDEGFLPPLPQSTTAVPIIDAKPDTLGLMYLSSQEKRLKPILETITEHFPQSSERVVTPSEIAAERITTVLDDISSTVRRGGMKDIEPLVTYGLELGISAHHILNRGLLSGMNATNTAYRNGEIFLTEMSASVATMNLAMKLLQPHVAQEDEKPITGTAVIGTVLGDRHDIGKNLVRIMLESRDIEVADLGRQVSPQAFVEYIQNHSDCNLVLLSINRDELLVNAREVIDALVAAKLRDRIFIMIGGAAASQRFAEEIGADAFTDSAEEAADKARELMSL